MSVQPTENPDDPRYEPRLYLVCWQLPEELWAYNVTFDRDEALKFEAEGYAVIDYARGGFIGQTGNAN